MNKKYLFDFLEKQNAPALLRLLNVAFDTLTVNQRHEVFGQLKLEVKASQVNDGGKCRMCGSVAPGYDGVFVSSGGHPKFHCGRCYKRLIAEECELPFEHPNFQSA